MRSAWLVFACSLVCTATVERLSAQAPPPPEMKPWVVMDVGPIPAPSVCGCVTRPFTVTRPRPGFGYASGLAAPDSDAPLTRSMAPFQAQRDAEDRANLPTSVENGLSGNGNDSLGIAWLISSGTAVQRDETQATAWFLLAAEQGHANAFGPLGHRYLRGLGVEQNDRAAAYWFQMGASNGDTAAMSAVGGLYEPVTIYGIDRPSRSVTTRPRVSSSGVMAPRAAARADGSAQVIAEREPGPCPKELLVRVAWVAATNAGHAKVPDRLAELEGDGGPGRTAHLQVDVALPAMGLFRGVERTSHISRLRFVGAHAASYLGTIDP